MVLCVHAVSGGDLWCVSRNTPVLEGQKALYQEEYVFHSWGSEMNSVLISVPRGASSVLIRSMEGSQIEGIWSFKTLCLEQLLWSECSNQLAAKRIVR